MPKSSNQLICDMALRFDNYVGCSHSCNYCFVKLKTDISKISLGESSITLKNWINKKREGKSNDVYPDEMPIHWGGVSDPFQPIEKLKKSSLECLKVFKDTQYPFVVSTKGDLIIKPEYLELIKDCNCTIQISAVCDKYDEIEKGAPSYQRRLEVAKILSQHKRVLFRVQPLIPSVVNDVIQNIPLIKNAGIYGIIVEFMKYKSKKEGTIKLRGDNCFPYNTIKPLFDILKTECHNSDIKIFAGENRLRQFGDGLNCCGVGDLYNCHTANLNHLLFDKLDKLDKLDNKECEIVSGQNTKTIKLFKTLKYGDILDIALKDKSILSNYTIDKTAVENIIYHRDLIDKWKKTSL